MAAENTDNIIAVNAGRNTVHALEYTIVTEIRPDFLLPATLVKSEGRSEFLYSKENMVSVIRCIEEPGVISLTGLFDILKGYINCLLVSRDMLLDTRLLSSDPGAGVFVSRESGSCMRVKTIWGVDELAGDGEKICRIAGTLAGCGRVMGSKTSMERMIEFIRSENPSLLNCLKRAETICREWNNIVSQTFT